MTKFLSLKEETLNPTVFTHYLDENKKIESTTRKPTDYDRVIFVGRDVDYGCVFIASDKESEKKEFVIFFGRKGNEEFEQLI